MGEEGIESGQQSLIEVKKAPFRPDRLYRGYTVSPEILSIGLFATELVPGTQNVDDPTRIGDGNERGVYMSTNPRMVESVYASGGTVEGSFVETPVHMANRGQQNGIRLPACGLVLEIDTKDLAIREPKMIPTLIQHYNNGYEGYEWIADTVAPKHYKVRKLVLSTHPNDPEKIIIDVTDMPDDEKNKAIQTIQTAFRRKKEEALAYKAFLEQLGERDRFNEIILKRKWQEYQNKQAVSTQ